MQPADFAKFVCLLRMQAKQRCSVLEDQIVDLIIVAMERSEETVDDGDDDNGHNTSCLQLWQHLSSQLIFFVLFQFSSFPHMVNALYEKVRMLFDMRCCGSALLVTCELFHLRIVTNTLQLLTGTIYRTTLETVALLAFLSVNLKVIFLALHIYCLVTCYSNAYE